MVGIGSEEEEGGLFLRFRPVHILILSLLLSLESSEKFVWWWWVVVVCKPILVFRLSLGQAEQQKHANVLCRHFEVTGLHIQILKGAW